MRFIVLVFIILLASCATHYNTMAYRGGYTEIKLGEDLFKINFKGNGYTSSTTVERYFLYRCAEIAKENNCSFFLLYDDNVESSTTSSTTQGKVNEYGRVSTNTVHITKSSASGVIQVFKEKPDDGLAYDVEILMESLEPYIIRKRNTFL